LSFASYSRAIWQKGAMKSNSWGKEQNLIVTRVFVGLAALCIALPICAASATSDWLSAPKPKFPSAALKKGSEGSVKLQVVLAKDGDVTGTTVLRSSGDPALDAAAQEAVLTWKMKSSAIKPSDLTKGRQTIVEFKQEAILAAVYPDRKAYFNSWENTDVWMFAPFPSYPLNVRQQHHTGKVFVKATIGADGRVASVQVLRSSGHSDLDALAVNAVRLWRAHKQYAGKKYAIPIDFVIGRRR
jgi:TonB family protein